MSSQHNSQHSSPPPSGQFALLAKRRFAPFFVTQFLGAFNDNLYKNALTNLITFQAVLWVPVWIGLSTNTLVNLGALVFILPFFLFSASAGQIADKFEKSMLVRRVKLLEIGIMAFSCFALWQHELVLLLVLLFLMGTQSALFSPVKYSYLPQHLNDRELVGGNGLVEMGTFVAILLGTIYAGILTNMGEPGLPWIMVSVMVVSIIGYFAACAIPETPAASPNLNINLNPFTQTWAVIKIARTDNVVFLAIMGISWFWAYGSIYMAQIFGYTRDTLAGDETVIIVMLSCFSVGIGTGSLMCEWMSNKRIELAMAPLGALGMLWFGIDIALIEPEPAELSSGLWNFLLASGAWRVGLDMFGTGVSGGLFIVTLYALVQQRSPDETRSRIIAANNIINSLFMVSASVYAVIALELFGLTIPQLFLATGFMHLAVCLFIFARLPEFALRFLFYLLIHVVYRIKISGRRHIPAEGPAIFVCNHVSFVDALIIGGAIHRPTRFIIDHNIYNSWINPFFRLAKTNPVAPAKEDPEMLERAFESAAAELDDGQIVCIFPEGMLTRDGDINEFRAGIERMLERNPVPVVPMALRGLWGSFFSHCGGRAMAHFPRRFWSRVHLDIGEPIPPEKATREHLQEVVTNMRGDWR